MIRDKTSEGVVWHDKEEMICGIYLIENISNERRYIGQSINIMKRLDEHRKGQHNKYLAADIKKAGGYEGGGLNIFETSILEIFPRNVSQAVLDQAEIEYIKKYNTTNRKLGYNIESGGQGWKVK